MATLRDLLPPEEQARFKKLYDQGYFNEITFNRYLQRVQQFVIPQVKNIDTGVARATAEWKKQGWTDADIQAHPFIQDAKRRRAKIWDDAYQDPNVFRRAGIELETTATALEGPWIKQLTEDVSEKGPLGVATDVGRSLIESVPKGIAATGKTLTSGLGDTPIERMGEMTGAIPVIGGLAGFLARQFIRSGLKAAARSAIAGTAGQQLSKEALQRLAWEAFEGGVGAGRAGAGRAFSKLAEGTRYPGYVGETADILAAGEHVGYEMLLEGLGEGTIEAGRFAGRRAIQGIDFPRDTADAEATEATVEHDDLTGSHIAPGGLSPETISAVAQARAENIRQTADATAALRSAQQRAGTTDPGAPLNRRTLDVAQAYESPDQQLRQEAWERLLVEAEAREAADAAAREAEADHGQRFIDQDNAFTEQQAEAEQVAAEQQQAEADRIEWTKQWLPFYIDQAGGPLSHAQSEGIRLLNQDYDAGVRDPIAAKYDEIAAQLQPQMGVSPSLLHQEADRQLRQQIGEKWYNRYRGIEDTRPTPQERAQRAAAAAEQIVEGTDGTPISELESIQGTEDTQQEEQAGTDIDGDGTEPAGSVPEETTPAERIGTENVAFWSDEDPANPIQVRPVVRELDELIPSHDAEGRPREDFPAELELQPREGRETLTAVQKIREDARKFNPLSAIEFKRNLAYGPPVTSKKHPRALIAGTGRLNALYIIRKEYPEKWAEIQQVLRTELEKLGMDPTVLDTMEAPVLTSELVSDLDEVALARDTNRDSRLGAGAAETAGQDAKYFDDELMALWEQPNPNFAESLNAPENADFRRVLFSRIPKEDQPAYLRAQKQEGGRQSVQFSTDGIKRVQNAMIRYVFGEDVGAQLANMFIETELKGERKAVADMVRNALGPLTYAKARGADIGSPLAAAILRFMEIDSVAGRQDTSIPIDERLWTQVEAVFQQPDMLPVPLLEKQLLYLVYAKRRSPAQFATLISNWAQQGVALTSQTNELFGETQDIQTVSEELFAAAIREHIRSTVFGWSENAKGEKTWHGVDRMPYELKPLREELGRMSKAADTDGFANVWIDAFLRMMNDGEPQAEITPEATDATDATSRDSDSAVTRTPRGTGTGTGEGTPPERTPETPGTPESESEVAGVQSGGTGGDATRTVEGTADDLQPDGAGSGVETETLLSTIEWRPDTRGNIIVTDEIRENREALEALGFTFRRYTNRREYLRTPDGWTLHTDADGTVRPGPRTQEASNETTPLPETQPARRRDDDRTGALSVSSTTADVPSREGTPRQGAEGTSETQTETETQAPLTLEAAVNLMATGTMTVDAWNALRSQDKTTYLNRQEASIDVHLQTGAITDEDAVQKREAIAFLRQQMTTDQDVSSAESDVAAAEPLDTNQVFGASTQTQATATSSTVSREVQADLDTLGISVDEWERMKASGEVESYINSLSMEQQEQIEWGVNLIGDAEGDTDSEMEAAWDDSYEDDDLLRDVVPGRLQDITDQQRSDFDAVRRKVFVARTIRYLESKGTARTAIETAQLRALQAPQRSDAQQKVYERLLQRFIDREATRLQAKPQRSVTEDRILSALQAVQAEGIPAEASEMSLYADLDTPDQAHSRPIAETKTLAGVQAPDTSQTELDLPKSVTDNPRKLSPAQQTGVKAILSAFTRKIHTDTDQTVQGGFLLGDKMGIGKTRQALATLWHYMRQGINRHLVIAPNTTLLENYPKDMREMGGPADAISQYDSSNPQPNTPIATATYSTLTHTPTLKNFSERVGNQNAVADLVEHLTGARPTFQETDPDAYEAQLEAYRRILSNVRIPTVENVVAELRRQAEAVNVDNPANVAQFRQRVTPVLADLLLQERTQAGQQDAFSESTLEARVGQLLQFAETHLAPQPDPEFAAAAEAFEGVIVLDEMHLAASPNSQAAQQIATLTRLLPNAKFLYMSATPFKTIENFAVAERLGLWGANQPFQHFEQFRSVFRNALRGVKEVIPLHLKQMGRYLSRALSSKGTQYTPIEVPLTDTEKGQYDTAAAFVQTLRQTFEASIDAALRSPWGKTLEIEGVDGRYRAHYMRMFYGDMQKFFLAVLDAMKAQGIEGDIREQLAAGDKIIVQLENTWSAAIARAKARDTDATPGPFDLLIDFVESENSFPVHRYQPVERINRRGKPYTDIAPVETLDPETGERVRLIDPDLKQRQTQFLQQLKDAMAENPDTRTLQFAADRLKQIAAEAGFTSGEISGRTSKRDRDALETAFTETTDVNMLVLGPAGLTGINLPITDAIKDDVNGFYHYLLQSSWNVNAFEQGLGRGKRANSAIDPHYPIVYQDVPGADRVLGSTLSKFAEMGALAGQAENALMQNVDKGAEQVSVEDDPEAAVETDVADALEDAPEGERSYVFGRHGEEALYQVWKDMSDSGDFAIADTLGLPRPEVAGDTGFLYPDTVPSVKKFFQRLLHQPIEVQQELYQPFETALKTIVGRHRELQTLDTGATTLGVREGQVTDRLPIYTDPDTGQSAEMVRLSVQRELPRRSWDFIEKAMRGQEGYTQYGDRFEGIFTDTEGQVWAVFEAPRSQGSEPTYLRVGPRGTPMQAGDTRMTAQDLEALTPVVDMDTAQQLWETEDAEAATTTDSELFMATGLILPKAAALPHWNELGRPDRPRPLLATIPMAGGRQLHGQVIPPGQVSEVLAKVGGVDPNYFSEQQTADRATQRASERQTVPSQSSDLDIPAIVRDIIGEQTDPRVARRLEGIVEHIHKKLPLRLRGHRVRDAAEAALLGQLIRDPQVEHTWIVYRKADRIVKIEPLSLNRKGETEAGDFTHIQREAGRLGADSILRIHNHPSGVARWSPADKQAAMRWHKELGTLMAEDIIVDSGTYAYRTFENGEYTWHEDTALDPSAVGWNTAMAPLIDTSGEQRSTDVLYQNPLIRGAREAATYMLGLKHSSDVAELIFVDPRTGRITDTVTVPGLPKQSDPTDLVNTLLSARPGQHVHIAAWDASETFGFNLESIPRVDSVWVNATRWTGQQTILQGTRSGNPQTDVNNEPDTRTIKIGDQEHTLVHAPDADSELDTTDTETLSDVITDIKNWWNKLTRRQRAEVRNQRKFSKPVVIAGVSHDLYPDRDRRLRNRFDRGIDAEHMTRGNEASVFEQILQSGVIKATHPIGPGERNAYFSYGPYYRRNENQHEYGIILDLEKLLRDMPDITGTIHRRGNWAARKPIESVKEMRSILRDNQIGHPDTVIEIQVPRDVDINRYFAGVVMDNKVYAKEEYLVQNQLTRTPLNKVLPSANQLKRRIRQLESEISQMAKPLQPIFDAALRAERDALAEKEQKLRQVQQQGFTALPAQYKGEIKDIQKRIRDLQNYKPVGHRIEMWRSDLDYTARENLVKKIQARQNQLRTAQNQLKQIQNPQYLRKGVLLRDIGGSQQNFVKVGETLSDVNIPKKNFVIAGVTHPGVADLTRQDLGGASGYNRRADAEHMVSRQEQISAFVARNNAIYNLEAKGIRKPSRIESISLETFKQRYRTFAKTELQLDDIQISSRLRAVERLYNQSPDDFKKVAESLSSFRRVLNPRLQKLHNFLRENPRLDITKNPNIVKIYGRRQLGDAPDAIYNEDYEKAMDAYTDQLWTEQRRIEAENPVLSEAELHAKISEEGILRATHPSGDPNLGQQTALLYFSFGPYYRRNETRHNYGFILDLDKILKSIPNISGTIHGWGNWEGRQDLTTVEEIRKVMAEIKKGDANAVLEIRVPQDIEINEYLIGIVEDSNVYVKPEFSAEWSAYPSEELQADLAGQPSPTDADMLSVRQRNHENILRDYTSQVQRTNPDSVVYRSHAPEDLAMEGRGRAKTAEIGERALNTFVDANAGIMRLLKAWSPSGRRWARLTKNEFASGFGRLTELEAPAGSEAPSPADVVKAVMDERQYISKKNAGRALVALEPHLLAFNNLAKKRVGLRKAATTPKLRNATRTALSKRVWDFIEYNTPIENDADLLEVAQGLKAAWRDLLIYDTEKIVELMAELEKINETLYVTDSAGKREEWSGESFDGFVWDKENKGYTKDGKMYTIAEAHQAANKFYMPHYYRGKSPLQEYAALQQHLDALNSLLATESPTPKDLERFEIAYDTGTQTWTHRPTGKTATTPAEMVAIVRDYVTTEDAALQGLITYYEEEGRVGLYGHLERTRETDDRFYVRDIALMAQNRIRLWDRLAEVATIGQQQSLIGDSPRLKTLIEQVLNFNKTPREAAIRNFVEALNSGQEGMFERMPQFASGVDVALDIMQQWLERDADGNKTGNFQEIDIARMNLDGETLTELERIGLIEKAGDAYKVVGETIEARHATLANHVHEFYKTLAERKASVHNVVLGLGNWHTRDPLEVESREFWKQINDGITVLTLNHGVALQNLLEIPLVSAFTGASPFFKGMANMVRQSETRDAMRQLGRGLSHARRFMADTSLADKYLGSRKFTYFSASDEFSRASGLGIGLENAVEKIQQYVAETDPKRKAALRRGMEFVRLNPEVVDNIPAEQVNAVLEQAQQHILRGEQETVFSSEQGAVLSPTERLASTIERSMFYISDQTFKPYDARSLPKYLLSQNPLIRVFFKYKSWMDQHHRLIYRLLRRAYREAKQGNLQPLGDFVAANAMLGLGTGGLLWLYAGLQGDDDDKTWQTRLFQGFTAAQTFGLASALLELGMYAEGNWYQMSNLLAKQAAGPTFSVAAQMVGPVLTGDVERAGTEALRRLPIVSFSRRVGGWRLLEEVTGNGEEEE